ncbi:DUF7336 domain-containing protein [Bacillus cereus]
MKLFLLYVSYPYEGGYVYGVYSSREEAEKHMDNDMHDISPNHAYIEEFTLDEYKRIEI